MQIKFFLLLLQLTLASIGGTNRDEEIRTIDEQIQQLEEMKRGFEARALRHDDQAEYLQFEQQAGLETRRHIQIADANRKKAETVQKEIDLLQLKKEKLLRTKKRD